MRTFSMKSITLAAILTLTLTATPSFAARRDRDGNQGDRRGTIERIVDALRRFIVTVKDIPTQPIP